MAAAGAEDMAEGAEMILASDDVGAMSAIAALMSAEDVELGLEVARVAGEMVDHK